MNANPMWAANGTDTLRYLVLDELGEAPEVSEFCSRFPKHGARLERLLAVDGEFNDLADRRVGVRRDLDQIELSFLSQFDGIFNVIDTVAAFYRVNHAHAVGGDVAIDSHSLLRRGTIVAVKSSCHSVGCW